MSPLTHISLKVGVGKSGVLGNRNGCEGTLLDGSPIQGLRDTKKEVIERESRSLTY